MRSTAVSVGPAEFRERWRRNKGRTLLVPTLAERVRGRGDMVIHSNSSAGAAHMQDMGDRLVEQISALSTT